MAVNQPKVSVAHRGVTLLELLIVLTVMGIAAALVTPMLTLPRAPDSSDAEAIVTRARQLAISRSEGLHVQITADGFWIVRTFRSRESLDSGRTNGLVVPREFAVDALGSCVPTTAGVTGQAFDPLACRLVSVAGAP